MAAAAVFIGVKAVQAIRAARSRARVQALNADNKQNVVYLHLAPPDSTTPSFSPPSAKLVAFLRFHKVPHVLRYTIDNEGSPNGLMPFMVLNGKATSESEVMLEEIAATFKVDLTYGLTRPQLAQGRLERLAFEDSARFQISRQSMVDHPEVVVAKFARLVNKPVWVVRIFFRKMRRSYIDTLDRQGCGMLSDERYMHELVATLEATEALIGDKKFLLTTDKPTRFDFAVWSNLVNWVHEPQLDTPATRFVRNSTVLTAFLKNVEAAVFGDVKVYSEDYRKGKTVQSFA